MISKTYINQYYVYFFLLLFFFFTESEDDEEEMQLSSKFDLAERKTVRAKKKKVTW